MLERISIGLDLSDHRLRQQLVEKILHDPLLFLSEEGVPYPEEVIVSDSKSYIPKTGEVLIAVEDENSQAFENVSSDFEQIFKSCKRATCYWETANMNRSSMNSFNAHGAILEELAGRLLKSIKEKDSPSDICKAIVSEMPIAMILIDSEGYVSIMNTQAQKFFQGYDVSPLSRLAEIVLPDEFNHFLSDEECDNKELLFNGENTKLKKFSIPIVNKLAAQVLLFY